MKKFIVLYHAPVSAMQQMANATPEQAKAGMDAWMAWAKKAGTAIVDLGMPLGNGKTLGGTVSVGSADNVAGYSVVQSESMDSAAKLFRDHPHLKVPGFSIQILEGLPMAGM